MTPNDFISKYKSSVQEACSGTPIFVSVTLAQAALETGWGKSSIGNNMFGIKATGSTNLYWRGKKRLVTTHEVIKGVSQIKKCWFRDYDSVADSIRDHNRLLLTSPIYKRVREAKTPEEQCRMLKACGYATAINYDKTLISIINSRNLKQYDK